MGPRGKIGPPGERGPEGKRGVRGIRGPKGESGISALNGCKHRVIESMPSRESFVEIGISGPSPVSNTYMYICMTSYVVTTFLTSYLDKLVDSI
jgi:hypothetical protein